MDSRKVHCQINNFILFGFIMNHKSSTHGVVLLDNLKSDKYYIRSMIQSNLIILQETKLPYEDYYDFGNIVIR